MISSEFDPPLSHPYYFIRKGLLNKIRQHKDSMRGSLLDFGCGSKPYKTVFNVDEYIGVDFENEGHPHLNEQIDVFYDGKHIPFADNRFDSIFCSEVFEHIFNLDDILNELVRVLKPEGKMLITCPFIWPEHEKPFDFARYTVFALRDRLEKHGFEVIEEDKSGDFFTAVFQMRVVYLHDIFLPKLSIPFLIRLSQMILIPVANVAGLLLGKILPTNKGLYLSNVIVAQKKHR